MADDFERALLITFNFSGTVDAALRARATAFVADIKANPEVWRLCCERFPSTQYSEVRFWCLQTLHEVVRASYSSFPEQSRAEIKGALLTWLQRDCVDLKTGLPSFLRNKLSQTLVAVLQFEFPVTWPRFFQDLVGVLVLGEGMVDMFCRIMTAVDEDLVTLDIPRSQDESKLSMHIKDSMREHAISDVAAAWFNLVEAYQVKDPDLASYVLQTMQRYISWIDINLVANPKFMSLLLSLLDGAHAGLKGAAADCLSEVLSKRMDAVPKLTLVQSMGIVPRCAAWAGGFPGTADDEQLSLRLARLLATLATEIIDSLKRLENGVISLSAMGFAVDDEAAVEVRRASELGSQQMEALFPAIMAAFKSDIDEVALPLLPFMHTYVARLKVLHKRNQGLPMEAVLHVRSILEGLCVCARYPQDSCNSNGGALGSAAAAAAARDEQSEVEDKRRDLFTLFKNISKIAFPESLAFVSAQLQRVTSAPPAGHPAATFQEVEVAVILLYELGEGAPEEALKPDSGALGRLAVALMQANLPAARHRLVALAVMETFVRYARVLQQHAHVVPSAIMTFLDERGMGHPAEDVSTRACYLFCRLVKNLRSILRPFVATILSSLQPHLARIMTQPLMEPAAAGSGAAGAAGVAGGAGAGTRDGGQRAASAIVDDRLYVFEAVGLLLGQEEVAAEEQQQLLSALLQPLREQIESHLSLRSPSSPGLILQALEAVVRLNKGFRTDLCTRTRPQLGRMFIACFEVAIQIPRAFPSNKLLRTRFISSVHRLVECLGPTLLPYLPTALEVLVSSESDAADLSEVLSLVNQLILKFKEAMMGLLQGLLPLLVARLHTHLGADWDWSGKMAAPAAVAAVGTEAMLQTGVASAVSLEDARERGELQKSYFSLLHVVVHASLSESLLKMPPGALDAVMKAVTQSASTHVDAAVRRTCLQILERLVSDWCGPSANAQPAAAPAAAPATAVPSLPAGAELVPGFRRFAVEHFAGEACITGLLRSAPLFDMRDAATTSLIGEAAVALKLVYERCGDALLAHLCGAVLPPTGCPAELQQQIAYQVRESEAKELKESLRAAVLWQAQAQQQAAAAAGMTQR